MGQTGKRKEFFELLSEWEKRVVDNDELTTTNAAVRIDDLVKLRALAKLYRLSLEEIAGELLHKALAALEAEMPYIQGKRVIRVEEGNEIFEDVGPLPRYIDAQKQVVLDSEG